MRHTDGFEVVLAGDNRHIDEASIDDGSNRNLPSNIPFPPRYCVSETPGKQFSVFLAVDKAFDLRGADAVELTVVPDLEDHSVALSITVDRAEIENAGPNGKIAWMKNDNDENILKMPQYASYHARPKISEYFPEKGNIGILLARVVYAKYSEEPLEVHSADTYVFTYRNVRPLAPAPNLTKTRGTSTGEVDNTRDLEDGRHSLLMESWDEITSDDSPPKRRTKRKQAARTYDSDGPLVQSCDELVSDGSPPKRRTKRKQTAPTSKKAPPRKEQCTTKQKQKRAKADTTNATLTTSKKNAKANALNATFASERPGSDRDDEEVDFPMKHDPEIKAEADVKLELNVKHETEIEHEASIKREPVLSSKTAAIKNEKYVKLEADVKSEPTEDKQLRNGQIYSKAARQSSVPNVKKTAFESMFSERDIDQVLNKAKKKEFRKKR